MFFGWIIRANGFYPVIPWNHFVHGIKGLPPFSLFPAVGMFNVTKGL